MKGLQVTRRRIRSQIMWFWWRFIFFDIYSAAKYWVDHCLHSIINSSRSIECFYSRKICLKIKFAEYSLSDSYTTCRTYTTYISILLFCIFSWRASINLSALFGPVICFIPWIDMSWWVSSLSCVWFDSLCLRVTPTHIFVQYSTVLWSILAVYDTITCPQKIWLDMCQCVYFLFIAST